MYHTVGSYLLCIVLAQNGVAVCFIARNKRLLTREIYLRCQAIFQLI